MKRYIHSILGLFRRCTNFGLETIKLKIVVIRSDGNLRIKLLRLHPFKLDKFAQKLLSNNLKKTVEWHYRDKNTQIDFLTDSNIGKIWKSIPGGHKWLQYFQIYEKVFGHFQKIDTRGINVLEIGVYKGSSLKMWKKFFGLQSRIVGIDINEECRKYEDQDSEIFVRIGSQSDQKFLRVIVQEFGPFDLIIDDGSHVASHQISSFNYLFEFGLRNNGIYFIEDIHAAYTDGIMFRDISVSIVNFVKHLVDLMNIHYVNYGVHSFAAHRKSALESFVVPKITTCISEIRFFGSVIVIYKDDKIPPIDLRM